MSVNGSKFADQLMRLTPLENHKLKFYKKLSIYIYHLSCQIPQLVYSPTKSCLISEI